MVQWGQATHYIACKSWYKNKKNHCFILLSLSIGKPVFSVYERQGLNQLEGAQWLSGRVLDRDRGAASWSLTSVTVLCP